MGASGLHPESSQATAERGKEGSGNPYTDQGRENRKVSTLMVLDVCTVLRVF